MFKRALLLGAISGILAGAVSIAYGRMYSATIDDNFFKVITIPKILIAGIVVGILAAAGYSVFNRLLRQNGEIVFNFVFVILSMAAMVGAFGAKMPPEVRQPELFPGMAIPMLFFPALAWFTLKPLFFRQPRV